MRRYGFDDNDKYKSYINAKKVSPNKISEIEVYDFDNFTNEIDAHLNEPTMIPNIKHHSFKSKNGSNIETKIKFHDIRETKVTIFKGGLEVIN